MANRFTVEAVFRGVDRMSAPVSRMQNRVGKFTRSFTGGLKKLNRGVDGFTRGLRRMATVGIVALTATGAALADVINTGARFEQTLVTAAAKFPSEIQKGTAEYDRLVASMGRAPGFIVKGTEEFKKLQSAAAEVGRTTEFTATQSAEALNFLAMAGFNAESAIAALPGVVDLATVAQIDLGRATDIATDSLGAFNLLSKDSVVQQANLQKVSDLLVKTSVSANTSIEDMFETLKQGAPVAVAAGQSIETTAALIGIMANAGIKGSRAGTGLKRIMTGISGTSRMAARTFEELGIKTLDSNLNIRDATEIFIELGEAVKDLPSSERLAIFTKIFGERGKAGAINLANMGEATRDFRDNLLDITGVTQRMAAVMRDTFIGRMNSFKSAIEAVKISIFGLTEGPLADLLDRMIEWTRENETLIATRVSEWILKVVDNLDRILSFLRRVGVGLAVFFSFVIVLKTLIGMLTLVNLLMLANPATLITIGILALITAIIGLIFFWDQFVALLEKIPGPLGRLPQVFRDLKRIFFDPMKEDLKDLIGWLSKGIEKIAEFLSAFLTIPRIAMQKLLGADVSAPPSRRFHKGPSLSNVFRDREEDESTAAAAQVISPSERTARSIEEHSVTNTTEVTLRADAGTSAEVTKGKLGGGLKLQPSAGF